MLVKFIGGMYCRTWSQCLMQP